MAINMKDELAPSGFRYALGRRFDIRRLGITIAARGDYCFSIFDDE